MRRLGEFTPGLTLGYDPLDMWLDARPKSASEYEEFAQTILAVEPSIAYYYIYATAFAQASDVGVDLVGSLKTNGAKIDVWTLDADQDDGRSDGELLALLDLAFDLGVDQITTNTPMAIADLWTTQRGGERPAP